MIFKTRSEKALPAGTCAVRGGPADPLADADAWGVRGDGQPRPTVGPRACHQGRGRDDLCLGNGKVLIVGDARGSREHEGDGRGRGARCVGMVTPQPCRTVQANVTGLSGTAAPQSGGLMPHEGVRCPTPRNWGCVHGRWTERSPPQAAGL